MHFSTRPHRKGRAASQVVINEQRFLERFALIAKFGATGRGGVHRQALTPADVKAHAAVVGWFRKPGYAIHADAVGNVFVTRAGEDTDADPLVIGSHLDSQPTGGRYDGALGVLSAAEVLASLDDGDITTRRPVQLAIWMNEEGSRFSPVTMGSAVYAGAIRLDRALVSTDGSGAVFGQQMEIFVRELCLAAAGKSRPPCCYVELHIEQGPVLEAEGCTIGAVTCVQGIHQYRIDVVGREAHAGTTPPSLRKDAFAAARKIIHHLETVLDDCTGLTRFTVGRCDIRPAAPNTIPGTASFTVDLRHPDTSTLARYEKELRSACERHAAPCSASVTKLIGIEPVDFDDSVVAEIERASARCGFPSMRLISGATHDAANLARLCRSGMIFVPCRNGISHNEDEYVRPEDMVAGTTVLKEVVLALAG